MPRISEIATEDLPPQIVDPTWEKVAGHCPEQLIQLDALIGSGLDPGEHVPDTALFPTPRLRIATEGALGGQLWPGGRYQAVSLKSPVVDAYGCGDSFAAGVTAGLAAGWTDEQAINLGAHCGASCATHFGPYSSDE